MPIYGFGFGGPGRRGGGGGFLLFFLLIAFFGPVGIFIPLLELIIPVLLVVFGVRLVSRLINASNNKTQTTHSNSYTNATYHSTSTQREENNDPIISNAQLAKIDKKLTTYFKNNVSLPVIDDIALVTSGAKYTSIDQLYLAYKDEKVIKLGDFKNDYYGMYNKIVSLLVEFAKQPDSVMQQKVETPEIKEEDILSDAQKYINKIDKLNSQIPQAEITNGLNQTCDLLKQIELSKQSKQDETKLNKLYDYYLPILTGILENYKTLQDRAIKDDEFKKCESQLIKTIMLINQALKTLYSEMHEDDYLNINADMETLQTLIKKDGFDNDPFSTEGK